MSGRPTIHFVCPQRLLNPSHAAASVPQNPGLLPVSSSSRDVQPASKGTTPDSKRPGRHRLASPSRAAGGAASIRTPTSVPTRIVHTMAGLDGATCVPTAIPVGSPSASSNVSLATGTSTRRTARSFMANTRQSTSSCGSLRVWLRA